VTDRNPNVITVYAANPTGNVTSAPLASISGNLTLLNGPQGIALDSSGKIYAANNGNNSVTVYPALGSGTGSLNEAPFATITGGNTGEGALPPPWHALNDIAAISAEIAANPIRISRPH